MVFTFLFILLQYSIYENNNWSKSFEQILFKEVIEIESINPVFHALPLISIKLNNFQMAIITVPHKKETPSQTSHCQLHHYLVEVIMVSFKLQHTIIFFQVDTVLQRFYGAFDLKQAIRWIHGWVIHLPIRCSSKPWSIRTNYNPAGVDVDIAILQLKLHVEESLSITFTLGLY